MKSRAYRDGGVLVPVEQQIIGRWYYRWYRESLDPESLDPGRPGEELSG